MCECSREQKLADVQAPERRSFLKIAVGLVGAAASLLLAIPLIGTLVGTIYRKPEVFYSEIGRVASLPIGTPQDISFAYENRDAYLAQESTRDVWVIRHSADEVTVFSPICPHLGCHYDWDAQARQFRCPCHGSVFSITGKVLGGPSPRPLDALPHKIQDGVLLVEWEVFEAGIPEKVRV
jgi:menaquinol-cytochrome c reductase iron-sulfur subunit